MKFDNPTGLQIDQMIVMCARHLFVARAPVAEIVARKDVGFFEQPHGAIYGSDADMRVDGGGSTIYLFDVGMICRLRQNARDDPPLLGHLEPFVEAELLQPRDHRVSVIGIDPHNSAKLGASLRLGWRSRMTTASLAPRLAPDQARCRRARVPRPISFAKRLRWRA